MLPISISIAKMASTRQKKDRELKVKPTCNSSSSLAPVPLEACFLCHYCTPSWQNWVTLYIPENGKGCSCCPQRSLLCPCETAWFPLVRTPWPPSEPGTVEQLWGETLHSCKTPHSASDSWGRHPQRLSPWNIRHERADAFYSAGPPPESAGPGWCCATAGWPRKAPRSLLADRGLEEKETKQLEKQLQFTHNHVLCQTKGEHEEQILDWGK